MTTADHLRAALDENDAEATELQRRLEACAEMRRQLTTLLALVEPRTAATKAAPGPALRVVKVAPKDEKPAALTCDCGDIFSSKQALSVHRGRSRKHREVAEVAAPAAPSIEPPGPDETPPASEFTFACTECEATAPTPSSLNRHTLANHRRTISNAERVPA